MLTTERILTVVFASLYRLKTLDMKLFRGKGVRDSELPRTYFLSDGFGKHPEKPINRCASDRALLSADIALRSESKAPRATASRTIRSFIRYNERKLRDPE